MSARILSAPEVDVIAPEWRRRQGESWNADPAASWEWIAAARTDGCATTGRFLLLGSVDRPIALLKLSAMAGARIARPLGRGLDRMAWCPGSSPEEVRSALDAGRRFANLWLPALEHDVSRGVPACASIVHGEYLTVEARGGWDGYLSTRSRSLRKTLRLAANRATRGGAVKTALLDQGATGARIEELAEVERYGHRARGHLLQPERRRPTSFTSRLLTLLDAAGSVRTFVAYEGSRISAYLIGIVAGHRYLAYTMAVRTSAEELALGHRLFAEAIRLTIDNGEAVDLGNGNTDFKRRWATSVRPLHDVFVGGSTPAAVARTALRVRRYAGERYRRPRPRRATAGGER